jgi:hypothetical protein
MRDFKEDPVSFKETSYGLFLIRNTEKLTLELFTSLVNSLRGLIISFEYLQKGENGVLIGYLPHYTQSKFPSLDLVEIEDYVANKETAGMDEYVLARQININDSFGLALHPRKKHPSELTKKKSLKFALEENQYAAVQIVSQPSEQGIQITTRAIIKEVDSEKKISLIKKIKNFLVQNTSLVDTLGTSHAEVFEDYKKRTLIPRHVQNFVIDESELLNFIKN